VLVAAHDSRLASLDDMDLNTAQHTGSTHGALALARPEARLNSRRISPRFPRLHRTDDIKRRVLERNSRLEELGVIK
jgi:hypothetical protein